MATQILGGRTAWSGGYDDEGYREYTVTFQVQADDPADGPATVLETPGLPSPGQLWFIGNDADPWVWCQWRRKATPRVQKEPNVLWDVDFTFTNKPPSHQRPNTTPPADPLLEPPKINVSYKTDKEEATKDRFGDPVENSSHEQLRGPHVQFDVGHPIVKIEQNTLTHNLELIADLYNTVNDDTLWGLPRRCWKLTGVTLDRKAHPIYQFYWARSLEWEGRIDTWDRDVLDEGTKVLNGHWDATTGGPTSGTWVLDNINGQAPDPDNPAHFIHCVDKHGNPIKAILDGKGKPYNPNPEPTVKTCTQCPDGAPATWVVTGWNAADPGEELEILHDAGCTWFTALVGKTPLSLTYDPAAVAISDWQLENQNDGSIWGRLADDPDFDCDGPNVLTPLSGPCLSNPFPAVIKPKPASEPGKIHVEYYQESNFLLLGIPLWW